MLTLAGFELAGRAADLYPEGASSNPVRVNIFQSISAVPDYHEKFLFISDLFQSHFKTVKRSSAVKCL